jgi:hypothetical protein
VLQYGWLVTAVIAAILLTMWVTFTLTRLDRLHARVDAAWAALDAQLVRRAAALLHAADTPESGLPPADRARYEAVATSAVNQTDAWLRPEAENAVGRAVLDLMRRDQLSAPGRDELADTAARVMIARRFYNDAVRDTRTLRARRMPRLLHLAGHRAMPQFFDIDDTVPTAEPPEPAGH